MVMIIDVGNSVVKICHWDDPGEFTGLLADSSNLANTSIAPLKEIFSHQSPRDKQTLDHLRLALRSFLAETPSEIKEHIALVSTVPDVTGIITQECPSVKEIDHRISMPFTCSLQNPTEVGPDRFCNMAAAAIAGLSSALVVDAGTATTFDLMLDGDFRGGLIAPGMAFSALKLGEAAARLSPVPFAPCPLKVGTNSISAMAAGGFHVGIQGVQGVMAGLLNEYGDLPVIITGGAGRYLSLAGSWYDPHWTMRGAAFLK